MHANPEIIHEEELFEDTVQDARVRRFVRKPSLEALEQLFSGWKQLLPVVGSPCVHADHPDPDPTLSLIEAGVLYPDRRAGINRHLLQSFCQRAQEAGDDQACGAHLRIGVAAPDRQS